MHTAKIKIIDSTMHDFYVGHRYAYEDDSGIDLFISENKIIEPKTFGNVIKLGIKIEMINGGQNISYMLVPRSSTSKIPLRLSSSPGIIIFIFINLILCNCQFNFIIDIFYEKN